MTKNLNQKHTRNAQITFWIQNEKQFQEQSRNKLPYSRSSRTLLFSIKTQVMLQFYILPNQVLFENSKNTFIHIEELVHTRTVIRGDAN